MAMALGRRLPGAFGHAEPDAAQWANHAIRSSSIHGALAALEFEVPFAR